MKLRPPPIGFLSITTAPENRRFHPKMGSYLQPTDEATPGTGGHGGAAHNGVPNMAAGGAEGQ